MFSLDSVLTAVGLVDEIPIMIAAILIAVGVMLVASGPLSRFVHEHPSVKMLALAFLLLIGVTLVADGLGFHIDKAYIYFAMAFSVFVEVLNLVRKGKRQRHVVELNPTFVKDSPSDADAAGKPRYAVLSSVAAYRSSSSASPAGWPSATMCPPGMVSA